MLHTYRFGDGAFHGNAVSQQARRHVQAVDDAVAADDFQGRNLAAITEFQGYAVDVHPDGRFGIAGDEGFVQPFLRACPCIAYVTKGQVGVRIACAEDDAAFA